MAGLFDVSQPTISHHMKVLADAGLILARTEGKHHFVRVDHAALRGLLDLLPERFSLGDRKAANRPRRAAPV